MEKIEFISAADLPATEAEEVEVLCVENGELKRKPGASLGGGSSYDMTVRLWWEMNGDGEMMQNGEILAGTYEGALQKINSNQPALILVFEDGTAWEQIEDGHFPYKCTGESFLQWQKNKYEGVEYLFSYGMNIQFAIMPDNTINFDW